MNDETTPLNRAGPIRERNFSGLTEMLLLSGSLLGTWAHLADKSSRSRLCWMLLFPVLFTAHYSSFSSAAPPETAGSYRKETSL